MVSNLCRERIFLKQTVATESQWLPKKNSSLKTKRKQSFIAFLSGTQCQERTQIIMQKDWSE